MKKILVTGGAGFIGSSLTEKLLGRGDQVIAIDNFHDYYSPEQKRNNVKLFLENSNYTLIEEDFCDREVLSKLFDEQQPEVVAHLGAMASVRYSVKHPKLFVDINVGGTTNLLEESVRSKVYNFVFASTSSIYGQREDVPFKESDSTDLPLAAYPATKKAGELLGHAYHNMHALNFTALRFFNVYGPKGRPDMMPFIVARALQNDTEITLFDEGRLERDWTYIDDIVAGIMAAIDRPLGYEIINLGRGEPEPMTKFLDIMQEITGSHAKVKCTAAPASEPRITYADVSKALKLLDYQPNIALRNGLENFIAWLS